MFFDIDSKMRDRGDNIEEPPYVVCSDLLYADDTMLVSSNTEKLQALLDYVIGEGARYGLELNWGKTVGIGIHHNGVVSDPSGTPVRMVDKVVYLGGLLTSDMSAKPELSRRIGEAKAIFKALHKCWAHANITRGRKIELYKAIVVPKLMYNLESIWLLQADKRKLDGFHARCLRKILSIPSSFVSRISNKTVLERSGETPLSTTLSERQTALYCKIAALPEDNFLRMLTCDPHSSEPRRWDLRRKRGRPKQQWSACVHNQCDDHWF